MRDAQVRSAYQACQRITKRRAKNFYYAFITLPKAKRQAIYAAYAFCRFCDDYSDEPIPLDEKMRLLSDYRRQLDRAYEDHASQPVFIALMDAAQRFHIPREYFEEVIKGVEMDLTVHRYQTFEDLWTYCYRVASVVGLISLDIFQYQDSKARDYAIDLGIAMQLTNILRDIREDWGRDRVYLPLSEMAQFGYTEADLSHGVVNQPFANLMAFRVQRARNYFQRGEQLLPLLGPRTRVCPAVLGGLYSKVLDRIEQKRYNVYNGRIRLSGRNKALLTGRIWLKTMVQGYLTPARPSSSSAGG